MCRSIRCLKCVAVAFVLVAVAAFSQEAPKPPEPAAAKKTHTVKKGPFKVEVTLKGVFEAEEMTEVILRPEAWAELTMLDVVEHGTVVKKGDALIQLDTKRIDEAIRDAEAARGLAEQGLAQAEKELAAFEAAMPLDLADAERAKRIADEDLKRYVETDRPLLVRRSQFAVRNATNNLDYEKEELRQLEKMYKADDLTEETEEIVLKRQRDAVERQTFNVELVKIDHERTMTVELPRRDETTREAAQRQALALEKTKATLPLTLGKMRLDLEKLKYDRAKGEERLKKLRNDRELMAMKSPADGIVYWGKCMRGSWPKPDNIEQAIGHGGALKTNEVLMTIVKPRPICVRTSIAERDLEYLRPGVDGQAVPTAYPDLKLPARLDRIASVPASAESFDAKITLRVEKEAAAVMPGMACRVKLVPYAKKDAITVPPAAVFTDEEDEDRPYVYVSKKDAKPEKRPVAVGKKTDKAVEITEGLKEGDVVLLEKPEE